MKLSALDLSPIPAGSDATTTLAQTVALAQHTESLGFERFWVAEHHNAAAVACSCPEVLIARIASVTERIRVGAGGIMLPNHSPLKVAETFRVLHAMFPERVDLGLGRAPGTDPRTARALRRGVAVDPDELPAQIAELMEYLAPDEVPRAPFTTTTIAIPANVPAPELFVLSSSGFGAKVAAELGLGLAFAHHMNARDAAGAVQAYRKAFAPSGARDTPYAILSIAALCAATDEEAKTLAPCGELAMLRMAQGKRDLPFPSVEQAQGHPWDADENALRRLHRRGPFVGSPERIAPRIRELAETAGADEVMLLTMTHDPGASRRSHSLLAEALS